MLVVTVNNTHFYGHHKVDMIKSTLIILAPISSVQFSCSVVSDSL